MTSHKTAGDSSSVFIECNSSRTRRLERSLIRNPQNPQSPKLPLYKEILRILTKLRKNERRTKQTRLFFSSEDEVTSPHCGKATRLAAALPPHSTKLFLQNARRDSRICQRAIGQGQINEFLAFLQQPESQQFEQ